MGDFKPGDKIICTDPAGILQLHRVYTYKSTRIQLGGMRDVIEVEELFNNGFYPSRFVLLSSLTNLERTIYGMETA